MPRMTHTTLLVLRALMSPPGREMYGAEFMRALGMPSGTVYPLLYYAEQDGWVSGRQEAGDPRVMQRPRRRYYRITPAGEEAASVALEAEAAVLRSLGITG